MNSVSRSGRPPRGSGIGCWSGAGRDPCPRLADSQPVPMSWTKASKNKRTPAGHHPPLAQSELEKACWNHRGDSPCLQLYAGHRRITATNVNTRYLRYPDAHCPARHRASRVAHLQIRTLIAVHCATPSEWVLQQASISLSDLTAERSLSGMCNRNFVTVLLRASHAGFKGGARGGNAHWALDSLSSVVSVP